MRDWQHDLVPRQLTPDPSLGLLHRSLTLHLFVIFAAMLVASCCATSRSMTTPSTTWARTYGGGVVRSVSQTSDGGYIVVGWTNSFGVGGYDAWVVKLNVDGNVDWQRTYGGSANPWGGGVQDLAYSVQQNAVGDYIITGYTDSLSANSIPSAFLLRVNANTLVPWLNYYWGGEPYSFQQTSDGGEIGAGLTPLNATNVDAWVFKIFPNHMLNWDNHYGGVGTDYAKSIRQTSDGGYIVAGASGGAAWVFKLFPNGNIDWQRTYSVIGGSVATSIQQTSDGGYIFAGTAAGEPLVCKLFADGSVDWQKRYGGSGTGAGSGAANSIQQTSDGGYVVAGNAIFFNALGQDAWVSKLNSLGDPVWRRRYGGSAADSAFSVQQTSDGGYVVAGETGFPVDAFVLRLTSQGYNCAASNAPGSAVQTVLTVATPSITSGPAILTGVGTAVASATNTSATIIRQCP